MKRTSKHVFAVVRFDSFLPDSVSVEDRITIKEIVLTQVEAEREVQRLNALNGDKHSRYFWQTTRFVDVLPKTADKP